MTAIQQHVASNAIKKIVWESDLRPTALAANKLLGNAFKTETPGERIKAGDEYRAACQQLAGSLSFHRRHELVACLEARQQRIVVGKEAG